MLHEDKRGRNYFYVPVALIDDMTLTGAEKLVMISLISHYDADWYRSYPTRQMIAEETGLTPTWVTKTLKALEARGIIRVERDPGYVSQYHILAPAFRPLEA